MLSKSTSAGNFFYHYDGSGNVVQLTDAAQATVAAYSYDAYGQTISSSGAQAAGNAYRYSTKEYHASSGLYDYGFRFYSPGLGRWINRDPIAESGGINLYQFNYNSPTNYVDGYGLWPWDNWKQKVNDWLFGSPKKPCPDDDEDPAWALAKYKAGND